MNLRTYLAQHKALVEQRINEYLSADGMPANLHKSMAYSLNAGGKRIRPVLVFAGAEAVGGDIKRVMPLAVTLEMIHTFSLIHDDLPAMDDDDLRRGKPTNHKVFGEATAILAGDALLAEAFWILTKASPACAPALVLDVICDVAEASGARGMTGGQVFDMEATGKALTEAELENVHRHKTGKLLSVSVVGGAKLCGATDAQLKALSIYGAAIGLAFQIADDILDIEGTEEEIGKDVGSDVDAHKATYPAIIGIEAARIKERCLVDEAISALAIFDDKADPLREIAKYIVDRKT
ncbi:MAG: polyprenyl synthetase family protein [Deltaproteobacteria bacterium]|nr:polyprenyl synthetase family protein [Deltaproteobacteria bacterium]